MLLTIGDALTFYFDKINPSNSSRNQSTMAAFSIHILIGYCFLIIQMISSLTLNKDPNFIPQISLFGDAKFSADDSRVQFTVSYLSSNGLIVHKNPFKFRSRLTSFSTDFSFSIPKGNTFGLDFILVDHDFVSRVQGGGSLGILNEKKYLGIEFGFSNVGDNRIGAKMGSSVSFKVSNVSNLELNNGEKFKSWIDYDAGSKKVEVRLSKLADKRPSNPILVYSVDLLKMWGDEDVFAGIRLTNSGNSMESCNVYSWKFMVRKIPRSMHSMPIDPIEYGNEHNESSLRVHKRNVCPLTIVAGMIFLLGCGALLAFVVMFVRSVVDGIVTSTVFPEEYHVKKPVDFRYAKINVVVDDDDDDDDVKNAKTLVK